MRWNVVLVFIASALTATTRGQPNPIAPPITPNPGLNPTPSPTSRDIILTPPQLTTTTIAPGELEKPKNSAPASASGTTKSPGLCKLNMVGSLSSNLPSCSSTTVFEIECPNADSINCTHPDFQLVSVTPSLVNGEIRYCQSSITSSRIKFYNCKPPKQVETSTTEPSSSPIASTPSEESATEVPSPQPTEATSSSIGAIVGGVGGGLILLALIAFFFCRRSRRSSQPNAPNSYMAMETTPKIAGFTESPINDDSTIDYSRNNNLQSYLSTRRDLRELWMPLQNLRASALRGGEGLMTVTIQGKKIALKGIDYTQAIPKTRKAFVDAVLSVHQIHHPQITSVQGVVLVDSQTKFCIATEFMERGSLGAVLQDHSIELTRRVQFEMALDIVAGLMHVHSLGRIYGDLTPDKVLVSGSYECKLNIFQLMKSKFIDQRHCVESFGSFSIPFIAPEIRHTGQHNLESDIYSAGILLGFVFTRQLPFNAIYRTHGFTRGDLYLRLNPRTQPYDIKALGISGPLAGLITQCWQEKRRTSLETLASSLEMAISTGKF